jgi:hypothetical protein
MFTRLIWCVSVTICLGWPAPAHSQAPQNPPASAGAPSRPLKLTVVAAPTTIDFAVETSAVEVRRSVQTNYRDWFRLVSDPAEAEVIVELTTRGKNRSGMVELQGRLTIFDLYKNVVSAPYFSAICLSDCDRTLAHEIVRRTQATVALYLAVFESRIAAGQSTTATPSTAQQSAAAGPAAAATAAPRATPATPENPSSTTSGPAADRDDDLGVDMAIVKVDSANMRGTPATDGEVVGKLPRGSMLVLITREATEGWYNVVDARSGLDGWVHGPLVDLRLTSRTAGTPFQATQVDTTSPPKVEAHNESSYTLSLTVGAQKYTITPGTTLTLTIPAGTHRYIATAPGVIPAAGVKTWDTGHVYTWRFYVQ